MLKPWMVIGGVTLLVAMAANFIRPRDIKWFRQLERPRWLAIEPLIPLIWVVVFVCGAWSAYIVWVDNPNQSATWLKMGLYLLVEIVTVAYNPAMLWSHRLMVGTYLGGTGFLLALVLAIWVLPISVWATVLLLPYLIWSPIGTFATWQLSKLNPESA